MKIVKIIEKIIGALIIVMMACMAMFFISSVTCKEPGCAGIVMVALLPMYGLFILVPLLLITAIIDRIMSRKAEKKSGKVAPKVQKSSKTEWVIVGLILAVAIFLAVYILAGI